MGRRLRPLPAGVHYCTCGVDRVSRRRPRGNPNYWIEDTGPDALVPGEANAPHFWTLREAERYLRRRAKADPAAPLPRSKR